MTLTNVVTAGSLAQKYGVKTAVHSQPGVGKTPLLETLYTGGFNPIVMVTEPGMLTLRNSLMAAVECLTKESILEFMKWRLESSEAKQFGVTCIDSGSELCEIFLRDILGVGSKSGNKRHGLEAYGEMARLAYDEVFSKLYLAKDMHVVINCKQFVDENGVARAHFPGRDLLTRIPHLYDNFLHLETTVGSDGSKIKAFRCHSSYNVFARNRNGLDEFEPADHAHIINKSLAS